jgi:acyl carrier protein
VQPEEVLALMKGYFAGKQPAAVLETFGEQSPRALLQESLDVVDFVVYLEEELGRDIDINQLGEALVNKNFGALSVEVSRILAEE